MADTERTAGVLARLRELGVRLSVDDFGTGHSSLARLKHLPVDELKIDKGFVLAMEEDDRDAAIVEAAVTLAGRMRLPVVAEGVEPRPTGTASARSAATTPGLPRQPSAAARRPRGVGARRRLERRRGRRRRDRARLIRARAGRPSPRRPRRTQPITEPKRHATSPPRGDADGVRPDRDPLAVGEGLVTTSAANSAGASRSRRS
jgi:hypothetical protein